MAISGSPLNKHGQNRIRDHWVAPRWLLGAVVLSLLGTALAWSREAQAPAYAAVFARWGATREIEHRGPHGKVSARLLTRYVTIDEKTSFDIGSILSVRFPKAGLPKDAQGIRHFDREDTAEKIRKAMGFKAWTTRTQRDASVYEAEWTSQHRMVRIYMWETADTFSYSIAMFRTAYADSFALESELIQRHLAGAMEHPEPWMVHWLESTAKGVAFNEPGLPSDQRYASFLSSWIMGLSPITEVAAEPCPTCPPGSLPTCWMQAASCNEQQLNTTIGQLNQTAGGMTNAINGATAQAGVANGNWANTNVQFGQANANWQQTNAQLAAANKNWQDTNAQFKRTNDMLKQFMDNSFLFAAETAAGAATGALVVEAAVQGLSFVGSALIEAITHAKDDASRLEAFTKARELWEKTEDSAKQLEAAIDSLLDARQIAKGFGITREQLVSQLASRTMAADIEMDAEKKEAEKFYGVNQACFDEHAGKAAKFKELHDLLDQLKDNIGGANSDGDQALCNSLITKLRALRQAEGVLQSARLKILAGEQPFMAKMDEEYGADAQNMHRLQNRQDHASHWAQFQTNFASATQQRDNRLQEIQDIADREHQGCVTDVDNGKVCDRIERDKTEELWRLRHEAVLEKNDPKTTSQRKAYLDAYLASLWNYQQSFNSYLEECRKDNGVNIPGQIPIFGVLFRGGKATNEWCDTYLNGSPKFIDLMKQQAKARERYEAEVNQYRDEYHQKDRVSDASFADYATHANEMIAWSQWFTAVNNEQACLVSEYACDANTKMFEHSLVSRYKRLEAKVPQIEKVCGETGL
jgi:hypothetical protein